MAVWNLPQQYHVLPGRNHLWMTICLILAISATFPSIICAADPSDFAGFGGGIQDAPPKEILNCMVCKALVDEIEAEIEKIDPHKKVDIGSFRLDGEGNVKQNLVPYARSQLFLSDLMDRICSKGGMKDYVVAHYKSSGRPTLFRMMTPDGNMNPEMSEVDVLANPEVNDKLAFYCSSLVEEYEDDIISMFAKSEKDLHSKLCVTLSGVCPKGAAPAENEVDDVEPYDFEHEEL